MSFCIELFCVVTLQYQILVRIAIAYFIIEKKKAAPQPWQAIAQRFCSIRICGDDKMVNITDVKQILQFAIDAEIKVFLDGGWGVDALLGYQSRAHNDIDIFVEKNDYQNFIEIMKANGFYEIKMEYTTLNHTVWEDLKNRIIDLHCFEYTDEGEILYDGDCFPVETFSGKGRIEEIEVSCIEPYSQVMFHLGYEFDENDAHDVKLLCETLHIEIPNEYR